MIRKKVGAQKELTFDIRATYVYPNVIMRWLDKVKKDEVLMILQKTVNC